ncbi:hypothetical protein [Photorhabdus sp. RM323S]|uniref:hypothetical protein n=1 Tax=Photorhabdus sp. RM323S TaxID=3342828 RepID=UPI0036D86198
MNRISRWLVQPKSGYLSVICLIAIMDARILSQLLPAMIISDWSAFLTPVSE